MTGRNAMGAALAAVICAGSLSAQAVRGRVVDAATHAARSGVLAELRDSAGAVVSQQFTSPSGGFYFPVTAGRRYQIRIAAIGYERHPPVPFVGIGDIVTLPDIALTVETVTLPALQAMAGRRACGKSEVNPEAFGGLLASSETALEMMDATVRLGQVGFRMRKIEQSTIHRQSRADSITIDTTAATVTTWPVVSPSADTLQRFGFAAAIPTETTFGYIFWGPDLKVLFADWFLESHCYSIDKARTHGDTIVIHYEPFKPREDIVALSGDLILDRNTYALRGMSFAQRNLPPWMPNDAAGGSMRFAEISPGYIVPVEWSIWMPITALSRTVVNAPSVPVVGGPPRRSGPPRVSTSTVVIGRHVLTAQVTQLVPIAN